MCQFLPSSLLPRGGGEGGEKTKDDGDDWVRMNGCTERSDTTREGEKEKSHISKYKSSKLKPKFESVVCTIWYWLWRSVGLTGSSANFFYGHFPGKLRRESGDEHPVLCILHVGFPMFRLDFIAVSTTL